MKLSELSPAEGSVRQAYRRAGAPAAAMARPAAAATRARRPVPAARSVLASRAARCLWPAVSQARLQQHFRNPLEIINLSALNAFEDGDVVNAEALLEKGILSKCEYGFKVLGNGKVTKKVTVEASAFSASAKEAIEAAGGKAEVK